MGRWVDPAPFEGVRPRVPWWALVPGKLKWVAALVALVWLLLVGGVRLVLLVVRYPAVSLTPALLVVCWWCLGWGPLVLVLVLVLVLLAVAAGLVIWWGLSRGSFRAQVWLRLVTEWRCASVYVPRWKNTVRLAELAKEWRGREYLPKLRRVRSDGWRDRVRVIPAQSHEEWELRRTGLAHSFGARSCRVRVLKPRMLELDFVHADPLARPVPVPPLCDDADAVDLKRVVVGVLETGKAWRLKLLGNQVLGMGCRARVRPRCCGRSCGTSPLPSARVPFAWWASIPRAAWNQPPHHRG